MPTETMHAEEMVVAVGPDAESIGMESQTATSEMQVTTAGGVAARMVADMEDTSPRPQGKADSPSKKKGKP